MIIEINRNAEELSRNLQKLINAAIKEGGNANAMINMYQKMVKKILTKLFPKTTEAYIDVCKSIITLIEGKNAASQLLQAAAIVADEDNINAIAKAFSKVKQKEEVDNINFLVNQKED